MHTRSHDTESLRVAVPRFRVPKCRAVLAHPPATVPAIGMIGQSGLAHTLHLPLHHSRNEGCGSSPRHIPLRLWGRPGTDGGWQRLLCLYGCILVAGPHPSLRRCPSPVGGCRGGHIRRGYPKAHWSSTLDSCALRHAKRVSPSCPLFHCVSRAPRATCQRQPLSASFTPRNFGMSESVGWGTR